MMEDKGSFWSCALCVEGPDGFIRNVREST